MIDTDRAHHKIDREIDPVRLRMQEPGEVKGTGVLRINRQRPLYPLFSYGEVSGLKMPQAGIIQRCGGVFRMTLDLAAGAELFALHNLVQVK